MSTHQTSADTTREQALTLHVTGADLLLIDQAARTLGRTRSDYMLETLLQKSRQILLDRVVITLDPQQFDAFAAMLDHPAEPSEQLLRMMSKRAPWQ